MQFNNFTQFASTVVSDYPILLTPISTLQLVHPPPVTYETCIEKSEANSIISTEAETDKYCVVQSNSNLKISVYPQGSDLTSDTVSCSPDTVETSSDYDSTGESTEPLEIAPCPELEAKENDFVVTDSPITHSTETNSMTTKSSSNPTVPWKRKTTMFSELRQTFRKYSEFAKSKDPSGVTAKIEENSVTSLKCETCAAPFQFQKLLDMHILSEHGKLSCNYCPMMFDDYWKRELHYVKQHELEHYKNYYYKQHPRAVYTCKVCGVTSKGEQSHRQHMVAHQDRKFQCVHCLWKFHTQGHLSRHVKLKHNPQVKTYDFVCDRCERKFSTKHSLNVHISSVHQEQACKFCAETFSSARTLSSHMSDKHADLADIKCNQCSKVFVTQNLLKKHITQSHLKQVCFVCKETFLGRGALTRHQREKHRKPKWNSAIKKCYIEGCSWEGDEYKSHRSHLYHVSLMINSGFQQL